MIIFSKALADQATVWEALRVSQSCQNLPPDLLRFSAQSKPVVMWNLTAHCNLACQHCYMDAGHDAREELSLEEGIHLVDELAEMGVPILIFTGGEPLLSRNFYALAFHAREVGLRTVISTNGTLITPEVARLLAEAKIRYVGVSLDSASAKTHDAFRGVTGAHARALQGLKNARQAGLKTGLRITLTADNWQDVPALLNLALQEKIPRFCLYHLVPTGRGADMTDRDVTPEQRRSVIRLLAEAAEELKGENIEILTTDSPMDGAYLLELLKGDPRRENVRKLLLNAGGCSTGVKVANINHRGDVHPCHFMPQMVVGNVRDRSFRDIWIDHPTAELQALRDIKSKLKGACGACDYLDLCGGCRQKAYYYHGDMLAEDPTCILEQKSR
ncbi:MAG: pyrroloquinoline quinone biosynthesis protein PqqE [Methanosaeta sp. PtaU1.Bin112]|nr:MAG: pyrroloquinoline quinone biosynthesis protein PqqE [Methanosaeta sp. PtaU1.Bin112]